MKPLSASRISVLETCSWLYYAKYLLKIPDLVSDGALLGSILHLIFELFTRPERIKKRKLQYKQILNNKELTKNVSFLLRKKLKQVDLDTEDNYELLSKMILTGFSLDFYGKKGYVVTEPEIKFDIENENPKYRIKGFIDQAYVHKASKTVLIRDWKSSKQKFGKDDRDGNLQWLIYDLASKKIWSKYNKRVFQFVFPRFPRKPILLMPQVSNMESEGLEIRLSQIQKVIDEMDKKTAKLDMAFDDPKRKRNCNFYYGKPCPAKDPFKYYVLKDKDGNVVQSEKEIDKLNFKEGLECEQKQYWGCPAFY